MYSSKLPTVSTNLGAVRVPMDREEQGEEN